MIILDLGDSEFILPDITFESDTVEVKLYKEDSVPAYTISATVTKGIVYSKLTADFSNCKIGEYKMIVNGSIYLLRIKKYVNQLTQIDVDFFRN